MSDHAYLLLGICRGIAATLYITYNYYIYTYISYSVISFINCTINEY